MEYLVEKCHSNFASILSHIGEASTIRYSLDLSPTAPILRTHNYEIMRMGIKISLGNSSNVMGRGCIPGIEQYVSVCCACLVSSHVLCTKQGFKTLLGPLSASIPLMCGNSSTTDLGNLNKLISCAAAAAGVWVSSLLFSGVCGDTYFSHQKNRMHFLRHRKRRPYGGGCSWREIK